MANYLVFPDDAEQGVARHFSSIRSAKIYAGTLAGKRNMNVRVWRENLKTGIMQRAATVRSYYATKDIRGRNPHQLSVPEKHQLKVALQTLKYSDVGARIMGGPTKAEAREIIKRLTGRVVKENPGTWTVTFGGTRRVFYTQYHAEQFCRALRLNGTACHITEGKSKNPAGRDTRYSVVKHGDSPRHGTIFESLTLARKYQKKWGGGFAIYKLNMATGEYTALNPAAPVEAIPSQWTRATVTTKGKQVQIRIGGRR